MNQYRLTLDISRLNGVEIKDVKLVLNRGWKPRLSSWHQDNGRITAVFRTKRPLDRLWEYAPSTLKVFVLVPSEEYGPLVGHWLGVPVIEVEKIEGG